MYSCGWYHPQSEDLTRCEKFLFAIPKGDGKGWGPERPPPFLTCLFCRLWTHACSEGQFPRNTLLFLTFVIKHIFLHSSTKIRYWPTAHLTKAVFFPAVCLLMTMRLRTHFYFPMYPHWQRRPVSLFYFCPLTRPYPSNLQILVNQLMFFISTSYQDFPLSIYFKYYGLIFDRTTWNSWYADILLYKDDNFIRFNLTFALGIPIHFTIYLYWAT